MASAKCHASLSSCTLFGFSAYSIYGELLYLLNLAPEKFNHGLCSQNTKQSTSSLNDEKWVVCTSPDTDVGMWSCFRTYPIENFSFFLNYFSYIPFNFSWAKFCEISNVYKYELQVCKLHLLGNSNLIINQLLCLSLIFVEQSIHIFILTQSFASKLMFESSLVFNFYVY